MTVQLYMATSIDGFVAKSNDDTNWVSNTDWDNFRSFIKEAGVIVMGRKTYEVSGDDFPYENALNVVMTSNKTLLSKQQERVLFTDKKPAEVVKLAKEKGFSKLLIIGGGKLNASFLKAGLIDEIILSVHPLVLGQGIKLFDGKETDVKLKPFSIKQLDEGLIQVRYKVVK